MDYYKQIFIRKSFHIFKNMGTLTDDEMQELEQFIKTVKPRICKEMVTDK